MAIRTNQLVNFKGEPYATVPEVETKIYEAVQESKISVSGSTGTPEDGSNILQSLKVIGDCKIIYGNDGQITLRIGPALNSSLLNDTDGITTAKVTYTAPVSESATLSNDYSDNKFIGGLSTTRNIVVSRDVDKITATTGSKSTVIDATTGAVSTKGNEVHFEGANTGKFKIYVNAYGVDIPFVVGPIEDNDTYKAKGKFTQYVFTKDTTFVSGKKYYKLNEGSYVEDKSVIAGAEITASTYYEAIELGFQYRLTSDTKFVSGKDYYILDNDSYVKKTVTAGAAVTGNTYYEKQPAYVNCAVTNYKQQPKTSSGASGYCACVSFTFIPENLFQSDVEFRLVKIEQIQVSGTKESVVATWNNSDKVNYVYLLDSNTLPGQPTSASYVLSAQTTTNTKKISGITYLTTSTTMTPSAQGLFNCGYPGYITNKLNCAPSGGSWFDSFNEISTGSFTTWTTAKGTTMNWEGTAKSILKGTWDNPQITVKGTNMHGSGTGVTSVETNNQICVCDTNGYLSSSNGTYKDESRFAKGFASAFSSTDLTATGNEDLQTFDGCIIYPTKNFSVYNKNGKTATNPNYSNCAGTRYAYLKLTKSGTIMGGTVTIKCVDSPETALTDDEPSLKIQLSNKPDDETSWMDLMDIGTSFSYDATTSIGFSIPQASSYGSGMMYCRVVMTKPTSGEGVKIKEITLG